MQCGSFMTGTRLCGIGHTAAAMPRKLAPYGSWASPITATTIARGSVTLSGPEVAANAVWWVEGRPREAGRQVIVRAEVDGSGRADAFGEQFSARTRVHEYGGGVVAVLDGDAVFSKYADRRLARERPRAAPAPPAPEPP